MSKQPVYWRTSDGKMVSIDEMDINHLRNVLKMIVRNSQKAQVVKPKSVEFTLNGDMAEEFNNSFPSDEDDDFDFNGGL